MGQGCRESQRSYLGRPVVLLSADSKPGCEVVLGRQESAEAIVPVPSHREGPNVEEDRNLSGSWVGDEGRMLRMEPLLAGRRR